ncbi:MAG: histidinol-phosphatase [Desulfobulbus sp.]|nr:histidinol-phosphatase [Desulfobulbus sp.]
MSSLIDTTFDGHVHTRLCNHAVGEMEEYVVEAIQRGLKTVCFLEHLETEIVYQPPCWLEDKAFIYYFEEGSRLKQCYRGKIEIRLGVEMGFNPRAFALIQQRLAHFPIERIGLSCHFHLHEGRHLNLLSRKAQSLDRLAELGADAVVSTYFKTLTTAVASVDCDVLCHLDAVLRHLPGICFNDEHKAQIAQLLDKVKARGLALEINTSGFDYRGSAFPAPWIITEALARDIPLQAGSDAHQPQEVGRYFEQLPRYLEPLQPH